MRGVSPPPPDLEHRLSTLGEAMGAVSPHIEFAYLFGSATGQRTPRSDVDVAIHVDQSGDAQSIRLDASVAAMKHLGMDAVDLVLLNTAPLALAGRILTTRRVILDRVPHARHRYESATARLFFDFRIREHRLLSTRFGRG